MEVDSSLESNLQAALKLVLAQAKSPKDLEMHLPTPAECPECKNLLLAYINKEEMGIWCPECALEYQLTDEQFKKLKEYFMEKYSPKA